MQGEISNVRWEKRNAIVNLRSREATIEDEASSISRLSRFLTWGNFYFFRNLLSLYSRFWRRVHLWSRWILILCQLLFMHLPIAPYLNYLLCKRIETLQAFLIREIRSPIAKSGHFAFVITFLALDHPFVIVLQNNPLLDCVQMLNLPHNLHHQGLCPIGILPQHIYQPLQSFYLLLHSCYILLIRHRTQLLQHVHCASQHVHKQPSPIIKFLISVVISWQVYLSVLGQSSQDLGVPHWQLIRSHPLSLPKG